ncbi:hypothetical protein GOBAR_DD06321 [Gossypium barbadense]|nr:hypothetical protein GOBAR_DD06321 [Gossypium barbadense]
MTKVYPNASSFSGSGTISERPPKVLAAPESEAILTVWKKSLLFNCNGFTVFGSKGDLVFRVDNYMDGNKGEILLMDATGNPLLTIRRKKMSLGDSWLVYKGETTEAINVVYEIEGSYSQRSCSVYDDRRRLAAEIKKKEAVNGGVAYGNDIFRLVVQPGHIRTDFAMALVILLDQMFGSSRR